MNKDGKWVSYVSEWYTVRPYGIGVFEMFYSYHYCVYVNRLRSEEMVAINIILVMVKYILFCVYLI